VKQRVYRCGTDCHKARAGFNRPSFDLLQGPEHRHYSQGNRQNAKTILHWSGYVLYATFFIFRDLVDVIIEAV
jgi:hypothetical protein